MLPFRTHLATPHGRLHIIPLMFYRFVTFLILCVLVSCSGPSSAPDAVPAANASISGTVRETGSGNPIVGAAVFISSQPLVRATTDGDGRFELSGLPEGLHVVTVSREGYVAGGRLTNSGLPFRISAGERYEGASFEMSQAGTIAGRVLKPSGEPARRVEVQLLQRTYFLGRPQWAVITPAGASRPRVESNERGEFRVVGVDPGQYRLRLNPREVSVENVTPGGRPPGPSLYPGVLDIDKAGTVVVSSGKETLLADARLSQGPRGWIRLALDDRTEESLDGLGHWNIAPVGWIGPDYALAEQRVFGDSYQFQPDMPGAYDISAMWSTSKGPLIGRLRVDYKGADVEGRLILDKPGGQLKGTVMVQDSEGAPLQPLPGVEVVIGPRIPYGAKTSEDGTFALPAAYEGEYKLGFVRGLPAGAYIAAARQGSRDVLRGDLEIAGNSMPLDIVVSRAGGFVEGTVTNAEGKPVHNAAVALVPESPLKERTDYYGAYQFAHTDQNGRFEISGVTPGPYTAYAALDVSSDAFRNADFLDTMAGNGKPLAVQAGSRGSVELKSAPISERSPALP